MALITNIGTSPTIVVDATGASHEIAVNGTLTIDDLILPYSSVDDGITKGWITVTNYTIPGSGGGGGGGGGGAVTVANGADTTQGAIADTAWSGTGTATVIAALKTIATGALDTTPVAVTSVDGGLVSVGSISDAGSTPGGTGSLSAKLRTLTSAVAIEDSAAADGLSGVCILGVRQDSDLSPVSADGDFHSLIFNSTGRAKVSVKPGATSVTVGNIVNATSAIFAPVARDSNISVSFSGTYTGVNATFEWSPDSTNGVTGTWYQISGARSIGNIVESTTGVIATGLTYNYRFNANGATYFRVRATAWVSGTCIVTLLPATFATEPAPVIGQLPTTVGSKTSALSLSTTPASDAVYPIVYLPNATTAVLLGSITTGGTAQPALAANTSRRGYRIRNTSAGDLWISTLAAAVIGWPSELVKTGEYFESPVGGQGTGALSIIGATTGQTFTGREW